MNKNKTILLTGAAGFIGSYFLDFLNKKGFENIFIADEFNREDKIPNYESKKFIEKIERKHLFDWLKNSNPKIDFVFHFGARTDTTEFDYSIHEKLNVEFSKNIWNYCTDKNIPLVYASSAATYGGGEFGYKDDHEMIDKLNPLNPYGKSKNEFDKWVLSQTHDNFPPFWVGLKFFNVYGPNEFHKGRMASMIFHGFNQIQKTGKVKLFKSHKPECKDGEQLRDFIYVADVAAVCFWLLDHKIESGIYNLGTGKARTFNDLAKATFAGMNKEPVIEYIDMPDDIRDKYQYFTEADINKLRKAGYQEKFHDLEEGVKDYVTNYLTPKKYF